MSRSVDEERPIELREAILRYLLKHGVTGLSLRPLAKAVGSSPRGLLYHFGSKEKLLADVIGELRQRQHSLFRQIDADSIAEAGRQIWKQISSPAAEPEWRLFFELYGIALRQPKHYQQFLQSAVEDWLVFSAEQLRNDGYSASDARLLATVMVAGLRGFLMDLYATQDRPRVNRAVNEWLKSLDPLVVRREK